MPDPRQQPPSAQRPLVLLIDDEPLMLRLMARALDDSGFESIGCSSGTEALVAMQTKRFCAAVSDVGMPGMNGIDLLRSIRQLAPELPVIIISGDASEATVRLVRDLGAFGYLLKPLDVRDLQQIVRRAADSV